MCYTYIYIYARKGNCILILFSYSNKTWPWNLDHISVIFPIKPPFIEDFPAPCLMKPEGT